MKKITKANYRKDHYYPRVVTAVDDILKTTRTVTPVAVFQRLGLLKDEHLARWRHGQVRYLEKVIQCNLGKICRILRILCLHAEARNLAPVQSLYQRNVRKGQTIRLRFSKTKNPRIERDYARHFVKGRKKPGGVAGERAQQPQSTYRSHEPQLKHAQALMEAASEALDRGKVPRAISRLWSAWESYHRQHDVLGEATAKLRLARLYRDRRQVAKYSKAISMLEALLHQLDDGAREAAIRREFIALVNTPAQKQAA